MKQIMLSILLVTPFMGKGMQDCEDDLIEVIKMHNQKTIRAERAVNKEEMPEEKNTVPVQMLLPKCTYTDLFEHFECYKEAHDFSFIGIEREELLQKSSEAIKQLDRSIQQKKEKVMQLGTLTVACLVCVCAPFIPNDIFVNMHSYIKKGVSITGGCGALLMSILLGKTLSEHEENEVVLKRHQEIKQWLTDLK